MRSSRRARRVRGAGRADTGPAGSTWRVVAPRQLPEGAERSWRVQQEDVLKKSSSSPSLQLAGGPGNARLHFQLSTHLVGASRAAVRGGLYDKARVNISSATVSSKVQGA